jgi:hypothetical protein
MSLTVQNIEETIKKHFPNASLSVTESSGSRTGSIFFTVRFALFSKAEWSHGIFQNDPASTTFLIFEKGDDLYSMDTHRLVLMITPEGKDLENRMAFSRVSHTIRKISGDGDTVVKKLGDAFKKFAKLVLENKEKIKEWETIPAKYFQIKASAETAATPTPEQYSRKFIKNNYFTLKGDKLTYKTGNPAKPIAHFPVKKDEAKLLAFLWQSKKIVNISQVADHLFPGNDSGSALDETIRIAARINLKIKKAKIRTSYHVAYDPKDGAMFWNVGSKAWFQAPGINTNPFTFPKSITQKQLRNNEVSAAKKAPAKKKPAAKAAPKGKTALKKTPQPDKTKISITTDQLFVLGKTMSDLGVMAKPPWNGDRIRTYLKNWAAIHGKPLLVILLDMVNGYNAGSYYKKESIDAISHQIASRLWESNYSRYNSGGSKDARPSDIRRPIVPTGSKELDDIVGNIRDITSIPTTKDGIARDGQKYEDGKQVEADPYIQRTLNSILTLNLAELKKVVRAVIGVDYTAGGKNATEVRNDLLAYIQETHSKHYKKIMAYYNVPVRDKGPMRSNDLWEAVKLYQEEIRDKNLSSLGQRLSREPEEAFFDSKEKKKAKAELVDRTWKRASKYAEAIGMKIASKAIKFEKMSDRTLAYVPVIARFGKWPVTTKIVIIVRGKASNRIFVQRGFIGKDEELFGMFAASNAKSLRKKMRRQLQLVIDDEFEGNKDTYRYKIAEAMIKSIS